ncbi:MAG: DUF58 domain-containing protein [Candidatus Bruticola sp.]
MDELKQTNDKLSVNMSLKTIPQFHGMGLPLFFLVLIIYGIATNTQSGWLFIITSIILAILTADYVVTSFKFIRHKAPLTITAVPYKVNQVNPNYKINSDFFIDEKGNLIVSLNKAGTVNLKITNNSNADILNLQVLFDFDNYETNCSILGRFQPSQEEIIPSSTSVNLVRLFHKRRKSISEINSGLKALAANINSERIVNKLCLIKAVGAHQSANITYNFQAVHRGHTPLIPCSLSIISYLGFWSVQLKQNDNYTPQIYIKPEVNPNTNLLKDKLTRSNVNEQYSNQKSDSDNFRGLHIYQDGEDFRLIHWASSARFDELIIKEFQETQHYDKRPVYLEIDCLIDPKTPLQLQPIETKFEMILSAAASVLYLCRRQKRPLIVSYRGIPSSSNLDLYHHRKDGLIHICRDIQSSKNYQNSDEIFYRLFSCQDGNYALERFFAEVQILNNNSKELEEGIDTANKQGKNCLNVSEDTVKISLSLSD